MAAAAAAGGFQPFIVYDVEEAEAQERQRLRDEAALVEQIQSMLGPSQELVKDIWIMALMEIEDGAEEVTVEHDITDSDLSAVTQKVLSVHVLDTEKPIIGTIKAPEGSVTFSKTADGWFFWRTVGNA